MKTFNLFAIVLICLFCSCEEAALNLREGTYIGEAMVSCSLVVDSAGNRIETTIYDASYMDTFRIEVIDAESRTYNIERSSLDSGPCEKSQYDIGFGGVSEYQLDEEFFWFYGFEYDKEWNSRLDLSDPKRLIGYMYQRDIFGKEYYDSNGDISKTTFYTFEYSIEADKQ